MPDPDHAPKYRRYKSKNPAVVRIDGHDVYLGRYDSPERWEQYGRVIATESRLDTVHAEFDEWNRVGNPQDAPGSG